MPFGLSVSYTHLGEVDVENKKVTFTVGTGTKYTVELTHPEILCTETDAGEYDVGNADDIKAGSEVFLDGEDVKDNFAINVTTGTLTIAKRPIVVVAATDKWAFDGGKMTNAGYAVLRCV